MHFAEPIWLVLLTLVPLLGWHWFGQRRAALRYPRSSLIGTESLQRGRWVMVFLVSLRLAVIVLVVVGLARPRWPDLATRIPARSTAIVFVLDVSGSMAEKDYELQGVTVSRLDAARQTMRDFIVGDAESFSGRGEDLIGLVTFAARVEEICPPTLTHSSVLWLLDQAEPLGVPPDSATNIGDALVFSLHLLDRCRVQEKVLVLLSDGEHNVPQEVVPEAMKPRQAARLAQALGVRLYAVSVGPGTDAVSRQARDALRDAAEYTGGKAFEAGDEAALRAVCQEIDRLERKPRQTNQFFRWHEGYPWLGVAAVLLLTAMLALESTWWRRMP
jgi:Ca-activated chloride channel family protein